MVSFSSDSIRELRKLIEEAISDNIQLQTAFKNLHQGYPDANVARFLKARDGNVLLAFKMLMDCLEWRVKNEVDNILSKPILPKDLYDAIRESQLIGMTGFCKQGRPVFAIGVGSSVLDKAPVDKYVQSHIQINEYRDQVLLPNATKKMGRYVGKGIKILDMSNLKLSALNHIKVVTAIATIDDLNYPEKTETYYVVNAPYIFSTCWKVVKPLLQERTKRKVQVLQGCGKDELLKIMDYNVLPHFCKNKRLSMVDSIDCYSPMHDFHVTLWNHIKQNSHMSKCVGPRPQKSFHVDVPEPEQKVKIIQSTLLHMRDDECSTSTTASISMLSLKD